MSLTSTHPGPAGGDFAGRDVVEITLPAVSAYLSVLRTATAGLAARLNFTLDEIEDLRIAVDEACAMLLPQADTGEVLRCTFTLDDAIDIYVCVVSKDGSLPARQTFAWAVLSALAGHVDAGVEDDGVVWIRLHKRRALLGSM